MGTEVAHAGLAENVEHGGIAVLFATMLAREVIRYLSDRKNGRRGGPDLGAMTARLDTLEGRVKSGFEEVEERLKRSHEDLREEVVGARRAVLRAVREEGGEEE